MQESNASNTLEAHTGSKVTKCHDARARVEQGRTKSENRMDLSSSKKDVFNLCGLSLDNMEKYTMYHTENNESDKWVYGNTIYKQSNNYKKREKLLERTISKEEADVNAAELIESIEKAEKKKLKKLKQRERKRSEKKNVEEEVNETKEKTYITMSETNLETISINSSVTNENSEENHDESVDEENDEDLNFLDNDSAFVNTVIKRNKKYDTMVTKATVSKCDKESTEGINALAVTSLEEGISADSILDVHNANFTVVKKAKRIKQPMRNILRTSEDYGMEVIQLALNNRFLEAIDYLSEAIASYPIDIRHYANRSYCYLRLGQYELALNDVQFIITNTDDINELARATCRAGQAFRGMQNYIDAEKYLERSVQLIPASSVQRELLRTRIMHLTYMGFCEKDVLEAFQRCSMTLDTITVLTERTLVKTAEDNSVEEYNCDNDDDIFYSDDDESPSNTRILSNIVTKWSMFHNKNSKNVHTQSLVPDGTMYNVTSNGAIKKIPSNDGTKKNTKTINKQVSANKAVVKDKAIWVGGLTDEITTKMLRKTFSRFGTIVSVDRPSNKLYAFINYSSSSAVSEALASANYNIGKVKFSVKAAQKTKK